MLKDQVLKSLEDKPLLKKGVEFSLKAIKSDFSIGRLSAAEFEEAKKIFNNKDFLSEFLPWAIEQKNIIAKEYENSYAKIRTLSNDFDNAGSAKARFLTVLLAVVTLCFCFFSKKYRNYAVNAFLNEIDATDKKRQILDEMKGIINDPAEAKQLIDATLDDVIYMLELNIIETEKKSNYAVKSECNVEELKGFRSKLDNLKENLNQDKSISYITENVEKRKRALFLTGMSSAISEAAAEKKGAALA